MSTETHIVLRVDPELQKVSALHAFAEAAGLSWDDEVAMRDAVLNTAKYVFKPTDFAITSPVVDGVEHVQLTTTREYNAHIALAKFAKAAGVADVKDEQAILNAVDATCRYAKTLAKTNAPS